MLSVGNRVTSNGLVGVVVEIDGRDIRVAWDGRDATWEVAENLERVYKFPRVKIKKN
jgi:hypothetical protein